MPQGTAVVIGAGVGGLTTAVALHRRGWRVKVLERSRRRTRVGAGIGLAPNAVKALEGLGLADWLGRAGVPQGSAGVRRPDGSWLVRTDLGRLEARFGRPLVVVPRSELVAVLVDMLPEQALSLDAPVTQVEPGDRGSLAVVRTARTEHAARVVVAADGINSAVRAALFPGHPGPAYAGFTAWRMIASAPTGMAVGASVSWGRGAIFGIVPMAGGRLYCYATANLPRGTRYPDEKAALSGRFADWHDPIPELIRTTAPQDVMRHDVCSLNRPLLAYHQGRVALLGDAAHAMTPNLGQGGCQAIEDAVVLAHRLGAGGADLDVEAALAAYTADRLARTTRIVRQSARLGRLQQLDSRLRISARDTVIRLAGKLGPSLMMRHMDPVAGWVPPPDAPVK